MPVIDGFQLIAQCRERGCDVAFVILSSYSDFEYAQEAIRASVLDYCLKPINPDALRQLLGRLRDRLEEAALQGKETSDNPAQEETASDTFAQILAYIKEHYQEKLTLADVAQQFSFNRTYICNLFKRNQDVTFSVYLNSVRIKAAKRLLETTALHMSEVAVRTGFTDGFYFNKVFKAACGITP